jgi:transposase-like protein
MSTPRRRYTMSEKAKVIRLILEKNNSLSKVSRETGIHRKGLNKVDKYFKWKVAPVIE